MTRKAMVFTYLLVTLLLLTACEPVQAPADPEESELDALTTASWLLTEMGGDAPLQATAITVEFAPEGKAAGNDGCNFYSILYETDGSSISFGDLAAGTMMACPDEVMAQAEDYMQVLADAASYAVEGADLILHDDGGHVIAAFAAQSQDLADSAWDVIAYNNGKEAVVSVLIGTELTAHFGDNGEVTGSGGCNQYTTTYISNDGEIEMGEIAGTRMACEDPEGIMEQEEAFVNALLSATTYKIDAGTLELRNESGAIAVTLRRAVGQ